MAYSFNFDLSKLSQSFFSDLAKFSERRNVHKKMGGAAQLLIRKFKVDKMTGLPVSDSVMVIEDLIDTHVRNVSSREEFLKTNKRALLLPHCARKYMDCRCKAEFLPDVSSYACRGCSPDCLVNKATSLAKGRGYDVYVLPGGSGIRRALTGKSYEGIVGVACTEEIKLGFSLLEGAGLKIQSVPLIKNGCSGTMFSMETLLSTL
ncbi:MAG: DUF116 domain-containing protein [Candidatus Aenigmatarchaeota archaeon]